MRHFPLFLALDDARIVLVGGGEQIAQKARLLGRTGARLEIMAAGLTAELSGLVARGRATQITAVLEPAAFAGARLVFVATGCAALDAAAADLARRAGALVNVVDRPALSDAIMPAIVDREPVVVAIGTEGTSPVLARRIKTLLEAALEPELGRFAAFAGNLRARVAARVAAAERRRFWEWACGLPRRLFAEGRAAEAMAAIEAAVSDGAAPGAAVGRVSLVETGAGASDLLTLRAVERLQGADLVLHDPDCPRAVLDLARRDAERFTLQADVPAWRALGAARRGAAEAAAGRQVVWLGDAEAAAGALARSGVDFERVPSVALARAEDGRADPDMRGTKCDRGFEVAAHAHGQA
jgi:uroporphyrin-III C-methyltransferase/precorrin-2 dehydrogenase/sirohydrochlorin ferrochelatase